MKNPVKLSIVIPVYNEEAVIETAHKRLTQLLTVLANKKLFDDYELIYVDDGSMDKSLSILKEMSHSDYRTRVISFSRNFGHQPALAAGLLHAKGDAVVSLDADLQDPPELIEQMLEKYREGNDIVYAARKQRNTDTAFKRATARLFYRAMRLMGVDIIFDHADYRLISGRVIEKFREIREVNLFLRGIFPYMGYKSAIVHYDRQERFAGETKYPLGKMLAFGWEGITSFSTVPLRLASFTGFVISLISFALMAWAFFVKITGSAIPGWASTVIPMFLIGGLNILFLGLIGEYIGKIYKEVKARPLFFIKEYLNFDLVQDNDGEKPRS
ncbi:MAG: glycosyltransferase family 2 protein [Thermodesulfovibrionales bacterium]